MMGRVSESIGGNLVFRGTRLYSHSIIRYIYIYIMVIVRYNMRFTDVELTGRYLRLQSVAVPKSITLDLQCLS